MNNPLDVASIIGGSRRQRTWKDVVGEYEQTGAARTLKFWTKYAKEYWPAAEAAAEVERPLNRAPTVDYICGYFSYRAQTGQARVGKSIALSTLIKELQQLLRFIRIMAQHSYSPLERRDMKEHLRDLVKSKFVSTQARKKAVALYVDSEDVITYLWLHDEYVYQHPRIMLQLSFWIILVTLWGLRVGELVESSVHRGSNEGLKYKDITLNLYRHQGALRYQIVVDIRNRKFTRDYEGVKDYFELQEELDPKKKFMCPVRWFLSLALSDDVFVHHDTLASFENRWIPESTNSRAIKIKDTKREQPIFRRLQGKTISVDKIMTAGSLGLYLKSLCERCGYTDPISCYSFRRGFGNGIEGGTSTAKFKKAMAHQSERVYQKSYMSNNTAIDVQNVLKGLQEDKGRLAFTRGIGFTRDFNVPKPHGSLLDKRSEQTPDQRIVDDLKNRFPKNKHSEIMRKARRLQFNQAKNQHLNYEHEFIAEEKDSTTVIAAKATCDPSTTFQQMLKYNLDQAAIVNTLWSMVPASLEDCVRPLLPLGDPRPYQPWYPLPIAQPDASMACPICGHNLASLRNAPMHLLECYCNAENVSFCFGCAKTSGKQPSCASRGIFAECRDCASSNHQDSWAVISWRGLLIKQGRCPFCQEVDQYWSRSKNQHQAHIARHLNAIRYGPYHCPDRRCDHREHPETMDGLKSHLDEIHGVKMAAFTQKMIESLHGRCPFCQDRYKHWLNKRKAYQLHIAQHLKALEQGPYHCPDQLCNHRYEPDSLDALKAHLSNTHKITSSSSATSIMETQDDHAYSEGDDDYSQGDNDSVQDDNEYLQGDNNNL